MEINEMELLWKTYDDKLERTIQLNERLLFKINFEKATDEFTKLLKLSVLGRNLALVYAVISITLSAKVITDFSYSLPGFFGALCMLLSFWMHYKPTSKLTALNFYKMPVAELQRSINGFKIHSINAGKYDLAVVYIWVLTLMPVFLKMAMHKNLYENTVFTLVYFGVFLLLGLVLFPLNKKMYQRMYGDTLSRAEQQLLEVKEFADGTYHDKKG